MKGKGSTIEIGLNAAVTSTVENNPVILRIKGDSSTKSDSLPYGKFDPLEHRTMEAGLRQLVEAQTGLRPGYVEQLYTFGDRGRHKTTDNQEPHVVSVGYLALARQQQDPDSKIAGWESWYNYLPWEDWRKGRPQLLDEVIISGLLEWATASSENTPAVRGLDPVSRVKIAFGLDGANWEDELVLDRYELMYAAGMVAEAQADGRIGNIKSSVALGTQMLHDHRRILATAVTRLRAKLKYRPVVFELMPDSFTLTDLQQTVECIFGRSIHKQNFRRLVENAELVEPTGASEHSTGGRPAALFRFRSDILKERPVSGLKVGRS